MRNMNLVIQNEYNWDLGLIVDGVDQGELSPGQKIILETGDDPVIELGKRGIKVFTKGN